MLPLLPIPIVGRYRSTSLVKDYRFRKGLGQNLATVQFRALNLTKAIADLHPFTLEPVK